MEENKVALIAFIIGVRIGDIAQLGQSKIALLPVTRTINYVVKRLGLDFLAVTPEEVEHVAEIIGPLVWVSLEKGGER